MTDQALIRRCVGYAEGWEVGKLDGANGSEIFWYENQNGYWYLEHPPQPAIDALAAELKRGLKGHWAQTMLDETMIWPLYDVEIGKATHPTAKASGPDFTMNDLRACDEFMRGQGDD